MHITTMLPPANNEDETQVFAKMKAITCIQVQPVGRWYEAYIHRRQQKQTLSQHSLRSSSSEESTGDLSSEEEEDEKLLQTLDPKEWKQQDHYAVLGMGKLRYKATDDQLKRAYKKKVLKHHPDKRKARGLKVKEGDDDYFTCITRAYETLGVPSKRRAYDSVDPKFDDEIPNVGQDSKDDFINIFKPVFEANARWSTKKRVPGLGDDKSTFEEVNKFYTFWYDFDSWREYSYLDEDDKEKGENRDERRWIEKQNKAERQKRKKAEVVRVRQLVDNAYACDPRIARFRDEEKKKKEDQKRAKKEAAQQKADEEKRLKQEALEAERKKKEEEEAKAREEAAAAKKEKDAQKKVLKKERKTLRTSMKDFDYFAGDETERVNNMQDVERLAELLSLLSLQSLNASLTSGDKDKAKDAFTAKVGEVNAQQEEEKQKQLEASRKQSSSASASASGASGSKAPWSEGEITALIKAVNLFPAGTIQRWETVGNFITQHVPSSKRSPKEVLAKAKDLQKDDSNLKNKANEQAFDKFAKEHKAAPSGSKKEDEVSHRMDSVADQQIAETGSNPAPWTAEEQKTLEQALKTFGASTPDRWGRISEIIPTRSKKDCMKRYKELVEMVRAKKAAAAAAAKKK